MNAPKVPGRLLAWVSLLVALAASVGANVAQARPAAGPRASSAVAPVLVVLAAGLLERVPLGGTVWWRRWLAYAGLGVVVAAAFVTSFDHQHRLLLAYGNTETAAVLLPIAVDGLIVLASVCLTVIAERRREVAMATATTAVPAEVPAPVRAELPAEARPAPSARPRRKKATVRRPVELTRQLANELQADGASNAQVAQQLGISQRRLRQVLQ